MGSREGGRPRARAERGATRPGLRAGGEGSMLARVLTLRFDPALEAFDDGPLQEFLKSKEVHAIRDHFFVRDGTPYLAVLVTYGLRLAATPVEPPEKAQGRDHSWRSQVSEADLPLFNALRDWRAERAKRDGIPPYMICTNKQLAAMVNARPGSLSRLGSIDGIGKAKLDNYGQELLALLARPRSEPDSSRGDAADAAEAAPAEPPATGLGQDS